MFGPILASVNDQDRFHLLLHKAEPLCYDLCACISFADLCKLMQCHYGQPGSKAQFAPGPASPHYCRASWIVRLNVHRRATAYGNRTLAKSSYATACVVALACPRPSGHQGRADCVFYLASFLAAFRVEVRHLGTSKPLTGATCLSGSKAGISLLPQLQCLTAATTSWRHVDATMRSHRQTVQLLGSASCLFSQLLDFLCSSLPHHFGNAVDTGDFGPPGSRC